MDFLGVGPLELILVFVIILIFLGPDQMVNTGQTLGKFIRGILSSDGWKILQRASRELRELPNRLAEEVGLEEIKSQLRDEALGDYLSDDSDIGRIGAEADSWTTKPKEPSQESAEMPKVDQDEEEN